MYREKYAQKRALELIRQNRDRVDITTMRAEEGADSEQVEDLTNRYYKMHQLRQHEDARQQLKQARMLTTSGAVLLICGLVLTIGSWFVLSGDASIIYYGLIGLGLGMILKGYLDKKGVTQKTVFP